MEELPQDGDDEENDLNVWKHVVPELNVGFRILELSGWPYPARARIHGQDAADCVCFSPCVSKVKTPIISELHCDPKRIKKTRTKMIETKQDQMIMKRIGKKLQLF